jgi:hypothetical protein
MMKEERDCSELELLALEASLEVELAELLVIGALNCPLTIEIDESCTTEVELLWVIDQTTHNVLLDTAAACHLLFLLI